MKDRACYTRVSLAALASVLAWTQEAPTQTPAPEQAGAEQRAQPFTGRAEVSYAELVLELRKLADELATAPATRAAYQRLLGEYALDAGELPLQSFSRVRLLFEATRDGGLWDLRWDITDQMPRSDRIWSQWARRAPELEQATLDLEGQAGPSAVAECDELSALFSILARDLGVVGFVGLHWPVWNHVVAVWQVPRAAEGHVRIVVPTTQIFLSRGATLGTRELATRRVVFAYKRADLRPEAKLPGPVARFLLGRARLLGARSSEDLAERRDRLGGS